MEAMKADELNSPSSDWLSWFYISVFVYLCYCLSLKFPVLFWRKGLYKDAQGPQVYSGSGFRKDLQRLVTLTLTRDVRTGQQVH